MRWPARYRAALAWAQEEKPKKKGGKVKGKQKTTVLSLELPVLKIANLICVGRFPFEKPGWDKIVGNLLCDKKYFWQLVNEERSPLIQTKIVSQELNRRGKPRTICFTIGVTGTVIITGVSSVLEAQKYYRAVFEHFVEQKVLE